MEESGVKWVIERFYRGLRNPLAAKPPYPKPSNLPNLHMRHALYPQYHGLSNLLCPEKHNKKVIKVLENQEKSIERFDNYGNNLYISGIFFPAS
jgi:hypothetical protein